MRDLLRTNNVYSFIINNSSFIITNNRSLSRYPFEMRKRGENNM